MLQRLRPPFFLDTMEFKSLNTVPEQNKIINAQKPFRLYIPPKTDVFASPALGYHFSAPILYTQITTAKFKSARATISVPFKRPSKELQVSPGKALQFDQAGLIFVLPHPSLPKPSLDQPGSKSNSETGIHPKWVKAGIEVWEGDAWGSIVARDTWSDWSLFELPSTSSEANPGILEGKEAMTVTLEADRVGDALMIYMAVEGGKRKPIRKVPWFFMQDETEETAWIGIYGARPDPYNEAIGNLEVGFSDFTVDAE